MSTENTTVRVEAWPVTADSAGLWLVSGEDALRSGPITQDTDPHAAAENLLRDHVPLDEVKLLHSTSWRADGGSVILTYIAVVACSEYARAQWQQAKPISTAVAELLGKANAVGAAERPIPRYHDVLMHGLRHLVFLLHTDSAARKVLCGTWKDHLADFMPALAGMYEHGHEPLTLTDASLLEKS